MKEVKYRAWDKELKVMYPHVQDWYDTLTEKEGESQQPEQSFGHLLNKPERYEPLEYTTLKDKNGVEIYEGDIVNNNNEYYPINPVIYYAGVINDHDGDYEEWYCGFCLDDVWHTPVRKDDEVIGNIYENPELLEEK